MPQGIKTYPEKLTDDFYQFPGVQYCLFGIIFDFSDMFEFLYLKFW
jgi:hypothetical protein